MKTKTQTLDKNPTTHNPQPTTKLTWLPKKTFELEFSLPWPEVKKTYDLTLKEIASQTAIKGFRKGKAPINLVEKSADKQKIYEEVIKKLLPKTYDQTVKQHHLEPIMSPKIQLVSLKEGENWQFKAIACERPEIKLGNYEQLIKGELAKTKIWLPGQRSFSEGVTPDKAKKEAGKEVKQSYDEKLKIVTQTLLNNIKVEIADILIEDEVNRMLTRFLDQVNSLGMTIEQYLHNKGITNSQLRQQYQKQAEDTLKIEFILEKIIENKKITVSPQEINKMIEVTPDEKVRQQLKTPLQMSYLFTILSKRKALDYLIAL